MLKLIIIEKDNKGGKAPTTCPIMYERYSIYDWEIVRISFL